MLVWVASGMRAWDPSVTFLLLTSSSRDLVGQEGPCVALERILTSPSPVHLAHLPCWAVIWASGVSKGTGIYKREKGGVETQRAG